MTSIEKLLKRFLRHPESVKYSDIERILMNLGFIKSYGKGSHCNFRNISLNIRLTIPVHRNDCLPYYKQKLAKTLKLNLPGYED